MSSSGGRFKKEIVVDGQSYLLLIRDEGGPPELQVRMLILGKESVFSPKLGDVSSRDCLQTVIQMGTIQAITSLQGYAWSGVTALCGCPTKST